MGILSLKNISFTVEEGDKSKEILKSISLDVNPGEIVTLFGKSGCGKSTLLNIIAGLVQPSSGSISFNGKTINEPIPEIAYVFQDDTLMPFRTVQQNVEFGLELKKVAKNERRKISDSVLKKVGLYDVCRKFPVRDKLSGGMKQRVEIAGVLVDQSPVILMDEPFSALDDVTREDMQRFVLEVRKEFNVTIVFVTHNKEEAILLSDRIVMMPSDQSGKAKLNTISIDIDRPRNANSVEFLNYKKLMDDHLQKM